MTVVLIEKLDSNDSYNPLNADELLTIDDKKLLDRLRRDITKHRKIEGKILIRCALCKEALYLKANPSENEGYHFSHFKTDDPIKNKCIQRTDQSKRIDPEALRALKYAGAKESALHYTLKHSIASILRSDKSIDIDTVKVEEVIKQHKEWRRPDVQAVHEGRLIAFEVQVSTEFAPMIAAREYFYERFGQILWILPSFDPDKILRQSVVDIATFSNDHIFVFDQEMQQLSKDANTLQLKAFIHWPSLEKDKLHREWIETRCCLTDIQFFEGHARILDVQAEEDKINSQIQTILSKIQKTEVEKKFNPAENYIFHQNSLDRWWDRWQRFTERLLEPENRNFFIHQLEDDIEGNLSSQKISLLWLAFYGISLKECKCTRLVIRALNCASKGELLYNYTGWRYIANQLLLHQPTWFFAFYKVLKISGQNKALTDIKGNDKTSQLIHSIVGSQTRLNDEQKRLTALIAPQLLHIVQPTPKKLLERDNGYVVFKFSQPASENQNSFEVRPDFLNRLLYTYQHWQAQMPHSGIDNLESSLRYMRDEGHELPFPNIPWEAGKTLYLPESRCHQFLPIWDSQLTKLERQLNEFLHAKNS